MALYAEIWAIGPYTPELAAHLDYAAEFYQATKPGSLVVARLFGIVEGTAAGRNFARCFGITDVWDFNQHQIDANKISFSELSDFFSTLEENEGYKKDLASLRALHEAGFQFIFRPNG
jgi:hypothetical protein